MKWVLPPFSFSGWFAFSFFVLVFADFAFRVAHRFEGCCGFIWCRSQGGPLFQILFWFSSVSGFGQSHFSTLVVTLPPTWHSSGTGQRRGVLNHCLPFNFFCSAAVVAPQCPAPEFGRWLHQITSINLKIIGSEK